VSRQRPWHRIGAACAIVVAPLMSAQVVPVGMPTPAPMKIVDGDRRRSASRPPHPGQVTQIVTPM